MIAIIPARGGSKGLPGKNIRPLNGKPLIQYTIEAAIAASCIERVVVTTDDKTIASVAKAAGADVPFIRPDYLSSDTANAVDVYIHAVEYIMKNEKKDLTKFMVLLPTAPLRNYKHIDEASKLFRENNSDTLISVMEAETPPSWYLTRNINGKIKNAGFGIKEGLVSNRQVNEKFYIPNGAIYILDYNILKEKKTYYTDNTIGYVMSRDVSVDIDTIEDFEYVEYLMSKR